MALTGRTAGKVLRAVVLVAWVALPIAALPDDGLAPSRSSDWGDQPPIVKFNCDHIPAKGWQGGSDKYAADATWLGEARQVGGTAKIAVGAMATMYEFKPTLSVRFPPLTIGDIVPAFGALYRVGEIVDLGPPDELKGKDISDPKNILPGMLLHRGWMTMALAEKRGLPQGLTFEEGSIAVPLLEDGTELAPKDGKGFAGVSFHADRSSAGVRARIARGDAGNARGPAAEVEVRAQDFAGAHPKGVDLPVRISNATVRRDGVLPIEGLRYKIRNVVPRDPKQHIIGWIELDPAAPIAPADHGAPHQPRDDNGQERYESPKAVFDAYREARAKRDARKMLSLRTPKAQNNSVFETFFACMEAGGSEGSKERSAILAKHLDLRVFDDFEKEYKKKYGVDYHQAMDAYQKDPTHVANPDDVALIQDVVAAHVKDKAGFVEAVAKHFQERAARRHTLDPVDSLGDLDHLLVEGDTAIGVAEITILPKVAGGEGPLKPGQSPPVHKETFRFRRINGSWLLDSP